MRKLPNTPWRYERETMTVRDSRNHCIMSTITFAHGGSFDAANILQQHEIGNALAALPTLLDALTGVEGLLYEAHNSDIPEELRAKRDVATALDRVRDAIKCATLSEEYRALGFKSDKAGEEYGKWLAEHGSPEYKEWLASVKEAGK